MCYSILDMSILQLYKGVRSKLCINLFSGNFFMGEKQVGGGGFSVLPALLTIKVDIALSKRYSRQPQASNRKLMTRLCMWHCSCAKLFPWQKKLSDTFRLLVLCMLTMFMFIVFYGNVYFMVSKDNKIRFICICGNPLKVRA